MKPLWPLGAKRGRHFKQRPLGYLAQPVDKTRPFDPPSFSDTDGEQPRRTPAELLRPKGPTWE